MDKKLTALIISICLLLASPACAQTVLTQRSFIETAVRNNPSYQITAQEYLVALEQNKAAHALGDWNLIITGLWNESRPAPISSFSAEYQKTTGYTVGLEKYLPDTGTAVKLEHGNTRIDAQYRPPATIPGIGTLDFNPPDKYYLSNISLSIVQPLWRNAFGLATRNALKMSDQALALARIKLSEDWEDFISRLTGEYLTWQKCHKNVSLMKEKVKTVENQHNLITKQLKYGLSEELDLVQLQQKLEAYQIMLEQAQLACKSQTRTVLLLMGRASGPANQTVPEEFKPDGLVMSEPDANSYLASSSNIKRTADIMVDLQQTALSTKQDAKKMDVSLVLSTKPNAFTQGFGDSLTHIGDYNENTLTISASRPLGNDKAEAEAAEAEQLYQKALAQREEIMLNSSIGLASLYSSLDRLTNIIELNKKSLDLAKRRLVLEKKKFEQGRNSVFFVLQAEDDLLAAENSYNETVFTRENVINQIKALTDRYLVEHKDLLKL
ncbi:MAG: TolC family protein [Candidatus Saganbacteria bacterium]|nr:TolC family protein [Candidatus Saganbacteria bacterium]